MEPPCARHRERQTVPVSDRLGNRRQTIGATTFLKD